MHHIYRSGQDIPNGIKQAHCAHKTLSNTAQAAPLHAHCRKHTTKRQDEGRPHPRTRTHAHCKIGIACLQSVLVRACDTQQAMLDSVSLLHLVQAFTLILYRGKFHSLSHASCLGTSSCIGPAYTAGSSKLRYDGLQPSQHKPSHNSAISWYSVKAAAARGHLFRMPW